MHTAVVLQDRHDQNPFRTGSILKGNRIAQVEASGVVVLPIEGTLTPDNQRSAFSTYFFRSFGDDQLVLKGDAPTRCCGMALEVHHELPYLHWLVCLAAAGRNPRAVISLSTDTGNGFLQQGSLDLLEPNRAVLEPGEFELPSDWAVYGGRARLTISNHGLAGFSLNAQGNDVAILWCAISQCAEPRPMKCLDR